MAKRADGVNTKKEMDLKKKMPECRCDVLVVTPPLVQMNAPYPAAACLCGHLARAGLVAAQADLSLALALRVFSPEGLRRVTDAIRARRLRAPTATVSHVLRHAAEYHATIGPVIRFLQGRDSTLASRIASRQMLPEGPRFAILDAAGAHAPETLAARDDAAKYLAGLYLDDLADAIRDGLDPWFGFARYADHLASAQPTFDPLARAVADDASLIGGMIDTLAEESLARHHPRVVAITAPFPGTVYGAFRIARHIRRVCPDVTLALGGGYVNTEMRELDDPRVFDFFDYVCLDDGEEPLERIARGGGLVRTLVRRDGRVVYVAGAGSSRCVAPGCPDYAGVDFGSYPAVVESPNPMHRIWSDGAWIKLPLTHGCYWHRCRFCDLALDGIGRYAQPRAATVVDNLERLREATGRSGFHFTDEALPPAFLGQLADEILRRGLAVSWWGNVRYETAFTPELAARLAASGCVAVTGGLECAETRLLALMEKGITLEGAARACGAFAAAGILTHAYLMYGFPTQTARETVDALDYVRQLFAAGVLQSAYWHRFALTAHSPLAADAARYGLTVSPTRPPPGRVFARNEIVFDEPGAPDHTALGVGLRRAIYNYMLGIGLDAPVTEWFDIRVPSPKLRKRLVRDAVRPRGCFRS
jgi:radical SAM superfamily enzyme YgiQ (UPF0313 family)